MTRNHSFHRSSRAQALADGLLVDVTDTAYAAGLQWPVAVTARLWADILAIPEQYRDAQDVLGRLWDVVWQARWATLRGTDAPVFYQLVMPVGDEDSYQIKLIVGTDDNGAPCITLMRPDEA